MSAAAERRQYDRIDRHFRLRFGRFGDLPSQGSQIPGELLDIGGGGLRFRSQESVEIDQQLHFTLEVPGWKLIENEWEPTEDRNDIRVLNLIGKVLWSKQSEGDPEMVEAGVCFTGILT